MNIEFLNFDDLDNNANVHVVDTGALVDNAKAALTARAAVAKEQMAEDVNKKLLAEGGYAVALKDLDEGVYTGSVRVTCPDNVPVRIEMRPVKGAMKVTEEPNLQKAFGPFYDEFFERSHLIQKILSTSGLIAQLKKDGINPWEVLRIEVRKGQEHRVAKYKELVIAAEAITPVKGFFGRLNEYSSKLTKSAKSFLKEYLPRAIDPTVILGTRGK